MKKQLLTLTAVPLLFIACSKSPVDPEIVPEKKLVKIEAKMTPFTAGAPVPAETFNWSRQEFDQDGNMIVSMIRVGMNSPQSYEEEITYKYENKKVIEKKEGNYISTYTYIGNTSVEKKNYDLSLSGLRLYQTETHEIGTNGKVSKINYYHAQGETRRLYQTTIFSYDANQRNTIKEFLIAPELKGNQSIYTFDGIGNILTESYFDRKQNTTYEARKYGYSYNNQGQLLEYIDKSGSDCKKFKNTYGADGVLTMQELFKSSNFDGPFEQIGQIKYTYTYK